MPNVSNYHSNSTNSEYQYTHHPKSHFFEYPKIETERLILRKFVLDDAPDVFEYCSQEQTSEQLTWKTHQNIDDSVNFIQEILKLYKLGKETSWAIVDKSSQKVIGSFGIHQYSPTNCRIEIGYVISPFYWGKGYMTEVLRDMTHYIFNKLPIYRIQIQCVVENIGSAKVIEKCGYHLEGTFEHFLLFKDKWWNVKQFKMLKPEWEANKNV